MKRKILIVSAVVLSTFGASAQFSVGLKSGYAFPAGTNLLGYEQNGTTTTSLYGTSGQGVPVSLELRYMFNESIGVQLDASFLAGSEIVSSEDKTPGSESKTSSVSQQIRLTPQLVLQTPSGFYGRFGAVLPIGGSTTVTSTDANGGGAGVPSERVIVAKGKPSLGIAGSLGYGFELSEKLTLFGELEYIGLGIKTASTEITKYEVGGNDVLPSLTNDQINATYEDETTAGGNVSQGSSSSYSSFGVNIGIRFTL